MGSHSEKAGAPSASAKIESLFGHVEEVTKDKGYRILKAKKVFKKMQ